MRLNDDFSETDHFKLLCSAFRFLTAADVLRRSDEYKNSSRVLLAPVLHLSAHGIEVLLKANLVGAGLAVDDLRKEYGHNIEKLWTHSSNESLRDEAMSEVGRVWQRAQPENTWPDNFDGDPKKLLEEYIRAISVLHTSESEFALRYIADSDVKAPRPHLLVETFLPISVRCVRQPRALLRPD